MNIREAVHDDLIHFIRMGRQFAEIANEPFDRDSLADHIEWILGEERAVAFIAFDGDDAVGICSGIWMPTFWDGSKITATEMWWFVDPACRNKGIGGALMDALESWAKSVGAWRLSMMTIVGIAPGVEEMYVKRGYREREKTFVKEL